MLIGSKRHGQRSKSSCLRSDDVELEVYDPLQLTASSSIAAAARKGSVPEVQRCSQSAACADKVQCVGGRALRRLADNGTSADLCQCFDSAVRL